MSLTPEEGRALRASIHNIARAKFGTLRRLADALGVNRPLLSRMRRPSPGLAVALWRLTGIPLDELLSPKLAAAPPPTPAPITPPPAPVAPVAPIPASADLTGQLDLFGLDFDPRHQN